MSVLARLCGILAVLGAASCHGTVSQPDSDSADAPADSAVLDDVADGATSAGDTAEADVVTDDLDGVDPPDATDSEMDVEVDIPDADADADTNADEVDIDAVEIGHHDSDSADDGPPDAEAPDAEPGLEPTGFVWQRVNFPNVAEHAGSSATTFALGDADGDGDLDVFAGALSERASCLYLNESIPGELRFREVVEWCGGSGPHSTMNRLVAFDFDGDGRDEVAGVSEHGTVLVVGYGPSESVEYEYVGSMEASLCMPVPMDTDWDGDVDLLVHCVPELENRYFERVSGGWVEGLLRPSDPWLSRANALAIGRWDVDGDGLVDLVRANDTFTVPWSVNTLSPPGGVLQACPPTQDCLFEEHRFGEGLEAWGSFMGIANVNIDGLGEVVYLTDAGPNRAVLFADDWTPECVTSPGMEEGYTTDAEGTTTELLRFSWGVIVDDFNLDGRDDLFVANGGIMAGPHLESQSPAAHEDALLIQLPGGDFSDVGSEHGVLPRGPADSLTDDAYRPRGAIKADLDLDGRLEIIEGARGGETRMYRVVEDGEPRRCTIRLRPTVVSSAGFGYAVETAGRGWRRWDVDGQYWLAAPPDSVVAPARTGRVRFPSGYVMPFECDGPVGPTVLEPEWIEVANGADVRVEIARTDVESVQASVDGHEPVALELAEDGSWSLAVESPPRSLFIQLNGSWIGRDWAL